MPVKMNSFIYPYTDQVKNLPVYLTGIGGKEYQERVKRVCGMPREQILYCIGGRGRLKYDNEAVDIAEGDIFFMPEPLGFPHGSAFLTFFLQYLSSSLNTHPQYFCM